MMKLILIFLSFFILSGCTINIGEEEKVEKKEEVEEKENKDKEEEKDIVSIGSTSSITNPLGIGSYGVASKYNAVVSDYKNVDVTIKEVFSNSLEIVDSYNNENPDNMIVKKDGFKYVVLEYEVIFYDFETESFGEDVLLDVEVLNVDGSSFIINDVKQFIDIYVLSSDTGVVNGGSGCVKIAFAIPDNITSYLVKFGTLEHTIAYYKI